MFVSMLVGMVLCIMIPFNAGFDEETHLARLYDISGQHFLPNRTNTNNTSPTPDIFFLLSYQRRYFQTPAFDLLQPAALSRRIDRSLDHMYEITTRSVYPPVNFLPQAVVAWVGWRVFNQPVIPVTIFLRMVGLWVYILGVYLAIRLLPLGKWLMAVLALSPMALFTAATINIDGFSTMTAFVFIALVLKLAVANPAPLGGRQTLALMAAGLVMALSRPNMFLLLPLLLALGYRRFQPRRWFFILWAGAALALVLTLGWNMVALPRSDDGGLLYQARLVLATPLHFIRLTALGALNNLGRYYREWVGVYGHWAGAVPDATYWLFPLSVLAAVLSEARSALYSARLRWVTLGTFLLTAGGTIGIMYMLFYHGIDEPIGGVQGRYFLPLAPLLLLPLTGLAPIRARVAQAARWAALALWLVTLGLYALGLGATYYTNCGTTLYTGGSCMQPVYKNLDKSGAPEIPVKGDVTVTQNIKTVCGPLNEVTVLVKTVSEHPEGNFHMELLDENGRSLAGIDIPTAQIKPLTYVSLPLNPAVGEKGKTYGIRITASTTAAQNGVALATSHQREYFEGTATVNGQAQKADLIFHYFCVNPYQ